MSNEDDNPSKSKHRVFSLVAKGFCMGSADVIPGVSGGTMVFILGIYRELIDAIKSFDRIWVVSILKLEFVQIISRPHFKFLIPLFSGIIFALIFFTRVVPLPLLLLQYPEQVYGLFFGLILGSCFVLIRDVQHLTVKEIVVILCGVIPGLILFNLGTISMPDTAVYVFLSGCLAISAMLLPGISGSFILLILNKYTFIFNAIGYFNMSVIVPFAAGMATGLIIFSRILSWLMHRYLRNTTLVIIGILISSLWVIWPFQERVYESINDKQKLISSMPVLPDDVNSGLFISVGMMILGLVLVILIDWIGKKKIKHSVEI